MLYVGTKNNFYHMLLDVYNPNMNNLPLVINHLLNSRTWKTCRNHCAVIMIYTVYNTVA